MVADRAFLLTRWPIHFCCSSIHWQWLMHLSARHWGQPSPISMSARWFSELSVSVWERKAARKELATPSHVLWPRIYESLTLYTPFHMLCSRICESITTSHPISYVVAQNMQKPNTSHHNGSICYMITYTCNAKVVSRQFLITFLDYSLLAALSQAFQLVSDVIMFTLEGNNSLLAHLA